MDIMIDIETLGTRQTSVITQIAAVAFDPFAQTVPTGYFNEYLNILDQDDRTMDLDTLVWWSGQPDDLFKTMLTKCSNIGAPLDGAIRALFTFIQTVDGFNRSGNVERIWANGIVFDLATIQNAAEQVEAPVFWQVGAGYRLPRCQRDVREALILKGHGDDVSFQTETDMADVEGQQHDALYDCKWQARYIQNAFMALGYKRPVS